MPRIQDRRRLQIRSKSNCRCLEWQDGLLAKSPEGGPDGGEGEEFRSWKSFLRRPGEVAPDPCWCWPLRLRSRWLQFPRAIPFTRVCHLPQLLQHTLHVAFALFVVAILIPVDVYVRGWNGPLIQSKHSGLRLVPVLYGFGALKRMVSRDVVEQDGKIEELFLVKSDT
jgi:hypothetical protein